MVVFRAGVLLSLLAVTGAVAAAGVAEDAHTHAPCSGPSVEPRLLQHGATLEAEIRGGEGHVYRLALPTGSIATCRVEQLGIDLVVDVLGPSGEVVRTIDDFFDTAGPLDPLVLTEGGRCGDLVVRPLLDSAAAGSYTIAVKTTRPAEPSDALRVRAQVASSEAVALRKDAKADSLRKAIERLREAAALSDQAGDRTGKATAFGEASSIHYLLSEPRQAAELTETALKLQEAEGDREGASSSHSNLGAIYSQVGDVEQAQQHYLRAIALKREIGDRRGEGIALNNFGVFLGETGDKQQSLMLLEQALALRREAKDLVGEGSTLTNLGALYNQLGESNMAKEYLERGPPLQRAAQDARQSSNTLNLLGRVRFDLGDTKGALAAQEEALEMQQRSGDRRGEATTALTLGEIAAQLGDHTRAVKLFEQALDIHRSVGNRRGEARALTALGSSHAARGATAEAKAAFEAALPVRIAVADRGGEVVTRLALSRLLLGTSDLEGARREAETALGLVEAMRTKITAQELRAGFLRDFRAVYDTLVDVLMRLDEREPGRGHAAEALSVHERGRARALLEALRESPVEIREGVAPELLDRERILRLTLASKAEVQMRLLSRKQPDTEGAAEVAREIDGLRLELDRVEAKIRAASPRFAALSPAQPLSLAEIQAQVLDGDTVLLEYALSTGGSYLWVVSRDGMSAHRLPEGVELERKARRAYELLEVAPDPERPASDELAGLLKELSDALLRPAASQIEGKRIVVVGSGALQYLPVTVLPDPGRPESPLVASHEVVWLPSASVAASLRRTLAGRPSAHGTLAVFADPVFTVDDERVSRDRRTRVTPPLVDDGKTRGSVSSGDSHQRVLGEAGLAALPRLPFTRREAENILSLVPARHRLQALDFDASLEAVRSPHLADYRILHFATHGFLDASYPQYSGIVLSLVNERGEEQRGFLSAADVFNLRLSADLVVLSGCRTGLGKIIAGEGVVGLTRAFLHAGSGRVVASLWPVDDAATAELMRRFYEGMLGKRRLAPAAALREAQLAVRSQRRWQAPFYWAGFQVQGEWR